MRKILLKINQNWLMLMFYIFFLCLPCLAEQEVSNPRYFYLSAELGAGHLIYAGFGYDFAKKFSLFKSFQIVKSAGGLLGFSYLSDDKVYAYEPCFFLTGEIVNNKIKISSSTALDIDWRLKIGKVFIKSSEFDIKGNATAVSADFLFKSFQHFFIDISLPFVMGKDESELAPCIGAGAEFGIF